MHKVIGGVTTSERKSDRLLVTDVNLETPCASNDGWVTRKRHGLVPLAQQRKDQGSPDKTRSTRDRDPHVTSMLSRPSSSKAFLTLTRRPQERSVKQQHFGGRPLNRTRESRR
jgi:hypothetical protein